MVYIPRTGVKNEEGFIKRYLKYYNKVLRIVVTSAYVIDLSINPPTAGLIKKPPDLP